MRREANTSDDTNPSRSDSDARFLGWQKAGSEVFALYNITAEGHPSLGSTVTEEGLLKLNLQIPQTPLRPGAGFRPGSDVGA